MKLKTIANQPSWVIKSDQVELAVTQLGGQMAPVRFYRSSTPIQPYHISPWQEENLRIDEPVLVPLRGDFFCAPFGAPSRYRGRAYQTHGEPAWARWAFVDAATSGEATTLTLSMRMRIRPGKVTKQLTLVKGQNVVYCRHVLEGFSGVTSLGHHATLAMPARPRSVHVATSPIRMGFTNPTPPGDPAQGSYFYLDVARKFASLSRVPTLFKDKPYEDCSSFPARKGYCDLFAVFAKPGAWPGWTAAVFEDQGFLWFSLKDPAMLPSTMFWAENHGRHFAPWSGRNNCLGLEDVCGFLAEGLAASAKPNALNRMGIPTTVKLSPRRPTAINYIQGVVKTPAGFGKVRKALFGNDKVTFVSTSDKKASVEVNYDFPSQRKDIVET